MSIYTVYEPPLREHESAPDPERFVFVRDGFSIWAFVLAPLWMLRHRLWLAFLGWLAAAVLLWGGSYWLGLSNATVFWSLLAIEVFLGLEGGMLRSAALRRRGYELADIVATDSRDDAERIFYARWFAALDRTRRAGEPLFRPVTPAPVPPTAGERIIGTFPDAEA